jgi:hypothetical protein
VFVENAADSSPLKLMAAPPATALEEFLTRHQLWIEASIGCALGEAITFEFHLPFYHLALSDLFDKIPVDARSISYTPVLRTVMVRWETPPGVAPHIGLGISRNRDAGVAAGKFGWDPEWKNTPIAIWLKGCTHALVYASVPWAPLADGDGNSSRSVLVVNRREMAPVLHIMEAIEVPKRISMIEGRDIPLPPDGYRWDRIVLSADLEKFVRRDFESFFEREEWFRRHQLPYRRGYLFYGPPGNGKTSVARLMACRPSAHAFGVDFRAERNEPYSAGQLSNLFDAAAAQAPSVVILEDIDKIGGGDPEAMREAVNVLLSCMDGLTTEDGVVVVATANHPAPLSDALLRRPGRFDRLAEFPSPTADLRRRYLIGLSGGNLDIGEGTKAAKAMDRFSFARIREAYILAGQFAFERGDDITPDDLAHAAGQIRREGRRINESNGGIGFSVREHEPQALR